MNFPKFHWGDAPPEEKPPVNPNEVLHERAYIVMKNRGELTDKDQAYVSEHLEDMLADEELQECWSRVNIGKPVFQYRIQLKTIAAEWKRTHPTIDQPYTLYGKFVVEPTPNGVNIYIPKEWKNKGKPDEQVKVDSPWLVAPAGSKRKDIEMLISNQTREDQLLEDNQKIREILGGKK